MNEFCASGVQYAQELEIDSVSTIIVPHGLTKYFKLVYTYFHVCMLSWLVAVDREQIVAYKMHRLTCQKNTFVLNFFQ
jgi:hypothetical protein